MQRRNPPKHLLGRTGNVRLGWSRRQRRGASGREKRRVGRRPRGGRRRRRRARPPTRPAGAAAVVVAGYLRQRRRVVAVDVDRFMVLVVTSTDVVAPIDARCLERSGARPPLAGHAVGAVRFLGDQRPQYVPQEGFRQPDGGGVRSVGPARSDVGRRRLI